MLCPGYLFPFEEVNSLHTQIAVNLLHSSPYLFLPKLTSTCIPCDLVSSASFKSHLQPHVLLLCGLLFTQYWAGKGNRSFRIWHFFHFQRRVLQKESFPFHNINFFTSLIYCHMSQPDINNTGVYLRENLQSLDIICQRIILSPYTLSLSM